MKTITYQTDKRHSSVIQKYGCYFLSLVKAGELLTGIKRDALRLFQRAVEKGRKINENNYVSNR